MKTMGLLQGLVSLQSAVKKVDKRTDHIQINLREHPAYGVSARQLSAQPSHPETILPVLLQGIKRAHTCQDHNCGTGEYGRGPDRWPSSAVSYMRDQGGKMIDLLYISKKAPKDT
jgi:hypothetical protein